MAGRAEYSIGTTSSTTNFPASIPGRGAPPGVAVGSWEDTGFVFPAIVFPTLVFPFGSVLGIVAPLGAFGGYFVMIKLRSKDPVANSPTIEKEQA